MARRWVIRQARIRRGNSFLVNARPLCYVVLRFSWLRERKQTWPRSSWMKFKSSSQPTRGYFCDAVVFRSDTRVRKLSVSEARVFPTSCASTFATLRLGRLWNFHSSICARFNIIQHAWICFQHVAYRTPATLGNFVYTMHICTSLIHVDDKIFFDITMYIFL